MHLHKHFTYQRFVLSRTDGGASRVFTSERVDDSQYTNVQATSRLSAVQIGHLVPNGRDLARTLCGGTILTEYIESLIDRIPVPLRSQGHQEVYPAGSKS